MSVVKIKKITLPILLMIMLISLILVFPQSVCANDISGTDWDLTSGVLTIKSDVGMLRWTIVRENYCWDVRSVIIERGVTSVVSGAFDFCVYLTDIKVDEDNVIYSSKDGVLFNKDRTILLKYPKGKTGSKYAIPNDVISIGNSAFSSVTVPDDPPENISFPISVVFSDQPLETLVIPKSVKSIGNFAFYGYSTLKFVTFEDVSQIETIGRGVFMYCESLVSINIPASVKSIGRSTFQNCSRLKTIIFTEPSQLETIGKLAFYYCIALESITIPDDVTVIENFAFSNCRSFFSVTIPKSVATIGNNVFINCPWLESVEFLGKTPPSFGDDVFPDSTAIIVPAGTADNYKNALNIKDQSYPTFIESDPIINGVTIAESKITEIDFDSFGTEALIIAFYNDCGFITITTRGASDTTTINIPIPETTTRFKIMMWDSLDNMSQLCDAGLVTKDGVWKSENISVNSVLQ